ncbi:MAG: toll/interleukin-1 receptor domain-containing protein [Planctomycetota bacterium]
MNQPTGHRVFLSHSSRDTWVAARIAEKIRACGAQTFLDEADIPHGSNFDEEITDAAKQCGELLVLLTPWAVERPYVWLEIGMFRYEKKRIVGVLYGLDKTDISTDERLPTLLKSLHLINLNDVDQYLLQLAARVGCGEDGAAEESKS